MERFIARPLHCPNGREKARKQEQQEEKARKQKAKKRKQKGKTKKAHTFAGMCLSFAYSERARPLICPMTFLTGGRNKMAMVTAASAKI